MAARLLMCIVLLMTAGCENALRGAPALALRDGTTDRLDPLVVAVTDTLTPDEVRRAIRENTREARDRIVYARLAELDRLYFEYERSIGTEARTSGLAAALAALGIGVGGTLTTAATASRLFSAGSSVIAGAQAAFNEQILADRTLQALVSQMRANRDAVKGRILRSLNQDARRYPLLAALADLELYRHAGSLQGALTSLAEVAAGQEREARGELTRTEAQVRGIRIETVRTPPVRPDAVSRERLARLNAIIEAFKALSDDRILEIVSNPPNPDGGFRQMLESHREGQVVLDTNADRAERVRIIRGRASEFLRRISDEDDALRAWESRLGIQRTAP